MTIRAQKIKNSMAYIRFLNLCFHSTESEVITKLLVLFQILINLIMTLVEQYVCITIVPEHLRQ
jgi:hypothetical protein